MWKSVFVDYVLNGINSKLFYGRRTSAVPVHAMEFRINVINKFF
ncbi:MAG: hypothetical protein JWQ09_3371 [Segetibacter sp.]|nr:hypothetical protein [Segetibacter sp.]